MGFVGWRVGSDGLMTPLRAPVALIDDFSFNDLPDWAIGVPVMIVFMIFVFALGWVLNTIKNAKFARDWKPLIPVIDGKVLSDGGGATTSWLIGTYRGWRVQAAMTPHRNQITGETGHYYNSFEIEIWKASGGQDWTIELRAGGFGFGEAKPRITAKDQALAERLERAGALDLAGQLGWPTLRYWARQRKLHYSGDVTPRVTPTPERFREELDLMLALVQLNERVNPPIG